MDKARIGALLDRLNDRLRNAHYWMIEREAYGQAEGAILEARGICIELAENIHETSITLQLPVAKAEGKEQG